MNLSYKIHDNFKKNHNAGELTSKRQISSHSNFVPKKMISLEFPANITLSLPKLTHNNLFYSRNEASNKPTAHLKTMTETNNSTFFKSPKKKNRVINFIQSKMNVNPMTINLKRQTSPLICRKEQSAENLLCNVYTDEPMQKSKEEVLKKINEENNLTEPILTEYSDIMVQELPNTKMFNNPKISKKISIESYENSTRTSSAFFGGKITQNNDFQYEKSVVKNSNMVFVINIDTGERQDINKVNQQILKQEYLGKMTEIKNVWQDWWQERKENNTQLLSSVKNNNIKSLIKLMEIEGDLKPDINIKDEKGWSPLHYSCLIGNCQLTSLLISYGSDVDLGNNLKQNPLIIATQKGFENLVNLFIDRGCNINVQDLSSNTALHYACIYSHLNIIKALLSSKDININLKNIENKTALQAAVPNDFEIFLIFDNFLKMKKLDQNDKNQNISEKNQDKENNFKKREIIGPNNFVAISLLGKGSFAEVYLVEKKDDKKLFAMKVLHKNKILRNNSTKYVIGERNILCSISHPFLVKLNYAFQTHEEMFLVLDYCPGGDLGKYLQKEKKFSEEKAKFYLCEVILAIEYLHSKDIIYRDLKPDNVVIDSEGHALLTDFGLSKEGVFDGSSTNSFCGSIAYLAPEILRKNGHGKCVDWYLLGVFLFEMLVGVTPYYSLKKEEIFSKIQSSEEIITPNFLSYEAGDLLRKLLQKNPQKRLGYVKDSEEIKSHEFFKQINWDHILKKKIIPPYPYLNTKKNLTPCSVEFDENKINQGNNLKGWSFHKITDF